MLKNDMKVNVSRLVGSIKLTDRNYLFPLFEAVVNAIQAIELNKNLDTGKVFIYIKRPDVSQGNIEGGAEDINTIEGFEIQDNGIGFDDVNFEAFKEAFTANKIDLGCKGVGRFMMLAAFNTVSYSSVYYNKNEKINYKRVFEFSIKDGVVEISNEPTPEKETGTILSLERYKNGLLKNTDIEIISRKLVEHTLIYFINNAAPRVIVYDKTSEAPIDLENMFYEIYEIDDNIDELIVNDKEFEIIYVKNFRKQNHQIHYCANNRVVEDVKLNSLIPVLNKHYFDDDLRSGQYAVDIYCKGELLNKSVENFRDELTLPQKREDKSLHEPVSIEELNEAIRDKVIERYNEDISSFTAANKKDIKDFIYRENLVEYRHLLNHEKLIINIPSGISDADKDIYLHKANYELEREQKARVNYFLGANPQTIQNSDEYKMYFDELEILLEQENDFGNSRLAKYMLHRKTIIKVFEKYLQVQSTGNYKLEADIHDIIFKRNATSNEIKFNEHNLWLLDERLVYSPFITSNKKFNEVEHINVNSEEAADLFVYDNKFAYGTAQECVVLFEFKRPMRTNYKVEEKDLGSQIKRYVTTIIDKQTTDYRGRPHNIKEDTPKFGFVVCDYGTDIETVLIREAYKKTPKGTYFKYEEGLNLYVEILNYDQLLLDVNLRHKAFFSRLGIDLL